jgi:adenylate cyclase
MAWRSISGKKSIHSLIIGISGAAIALLLWRFGWLNTWESKTWDFRAASMAKPGKATDNIRLILLDQNSLDWAKNENGWNWPWPREVYSAILDYCRRSGAKAVAFDVLFTEPSIYGNEDDAALGRAVAKCGHFTGAVFVGEKTGSDTKWPTEIPAPEFKVVGLDKWLDPTNSVNMIFQRATMPIQELAVNAAVLSNVHLEPDPDGIYRSISLFCVFDHKILPTLGLGAYLAANPGARMQIKPGQLIVDRRIVPIDRHGKAVLNYRGISGTHKAYSAAAVIQSDLRILQGETPTIRDKNAFRDKYVFFGFSAPGLYDLRSSPVDGVYPGVEIQATLLDNFLSGDFMRRSPAWLTITVVFFMAIVCAVSASAFSSPAGSVTVGLIFFSMPIFVSFGSYLHGLWFPLVVLEISVAFTIAMALVVNYATEGKQKRFIKNAFQQYLSSAVIEQLIQHPERLKLGGERKVLSIFFSDLQGFTSISEGLDPKELTALLNDYLSAMTNIIHEEGGTVDKYEGDAIIAFWNAPLDVPEHAVRAVRAAMRCQNLLAEMRPGFKERIGKEMFMRIGINTGPAIVGNLGSDTRFDYSMIGDAVNLASRLEGANKQFGTHTMISQFTRDMLEDGAVVRELARIAVVGRKEPVVVYEPMTAERYKARKDILETFSQGLQLFYKGRFSQALEVFSTIQELDPPAAAYAKKCRAIIQAPPDNWHGVWVMDSK